MNQKGLLMITLKKANINVIIYVLGEVFSKIAPFLLVPLISRVYGPNGISIYTNFTVAVFIIQTLISGWSISFVTVSYFKSITNYRLSIALTLIVSLFFSFLSIIFFIVIMFFDSDVFFITLSTSILSASFVSIFSLYLSILQVKKRAKEFVFFTVCKSFAIFFAISIFLKFFNTSLIEYVLIVVTVIHMFFGVIVIKRIVVECGLKNLNHLTRKFLVKMVAFGFPILPGALLNSGRTAIDRFVIFSFLGTMTVGVYSAAYQYCMVVLVLSASMIRAYTPEIFNSLSKSDFLSLYRLFKIFIAVLLFVAVLTNLFVYFLGATISGEGFESIWQFSFLSYLFVLQAATAFISSYYQFFNKTNSLLIINIIGFVIYFILCFVGAYLSALTFVCCALAGVFFSLYLNYWFGFRNVYKNSK